MKSIYIQMLVGLAALLCCSSALAQVSVTIDRDQIALDETLNLTISKDGSSAIASSDLQPLENDFRIVGQSQSSNTQFINGSVSSSFTLNLVLAPKRAGKLEIPPLAIGKEMTERLYVKVVTQAQPKTRADNAPLHLETDISERTVFVQSQLIFTIRIFSAVEANINYLPDPQLPDALLERLHDATFDKVVDGRSYKVFERKYAIFPQKSGVLEIPQFIVQIIIPDRQSNNRLYGFLGTRGKEVKLRSDSETITVKEKPPVYANGVEWLPTDKLSVAEEWSREPEDLQEGESATITIALAAQGLLGTQLPPIDLPETEGVKLYQGKAEVDNLKNSDGITGLRKESIALIPLRSGQVELPEIRIPWWNKKLQKVEYAVIPARKLRIKASASKIGQTSMPPAPLSDGENSLGTKKTEASPIAAEFNKPLLILCAVLILLWLVTLYLLLRTRSHLATQLGVGRLESGADSGIKESEAFRKFGRACRSNDPARARKDVIAWARAFCVNEKIQTIADLARAFPDSNLASLLAEMDNLLYNQGGEAKAWQGKSLLAAVEDLRKTGEKKNKNRPDLQSLYR